VSDVLAIVFADEVTPGMVIRQNVSYASDKDRMLRVIRSRTFDTQIYVVGVDTVTDEPLVWESFAHGTYAVIETAPMGLNREEQK
jgi:hypothetical protein